MVLPLEASAPPHGPGFTLGQLARRWGIPLWRLRRVYERGLLAEPARAGLARYVLLDQVPELERVAREHGYLPPATAEQQMGLASEAGEVVEHAAR